MSSSPKESQVDLEQRFQQAKEAVEKLTQRPSNDELLSLYALFKQATQGDVSGSRPGLFDLKGRAKFDAWAKLKGKQTKEAKEEYVKWVEGLKKRYA